MQLPVAVRPFLLYELLRKVLYSLPLRCLVTFFLLLPPSYNDENIRGFSVFDLEFTGVSTWLSFLKTQIRIIYSYLIKPYVPFSISGFSHCV